MNDINELGKFIYWYYYEKGVYLVIVNVIIKVCFLVVVVGNVWYVVGCLGDLIIVGYIFILLKDSKFNIVDDGVFVDG